MTQTQFRGLSRGDLLQVDGNGSAVVESSYIKTQDGQPKSFIDIRLKSGEVITGLSDDFPSLFELLSVERSVANVEAFVNQ